MTEKRIALLYQEIGGRVKAKRELYGLTQEKLAISTGLSRASISNIELGRQQLPIYILYSIAEVLKLEVQEFLPSALELSVLENKEAQDLESILNGYDFGEEAKRVISEIIKKPDL